MGAMSDVALPEPGIKRLASAGLSANLVGIGLARFAYTPLIPVLIAAAWFSPAEAAYLGAINLIGYLAGAWAARPLGARWPAPPVLRAMMVVATVAFFACALNLGFAWFALWRGAAGVSGGAIMALAAPTVLPYAAPARRGLTGGVLFAGVGMGVAASGSLVPLLLGWGLVATWCGLGVLSAVLTLFAWGGWPRAAAASTDARAAAAPRGATPAIRALLVEYGLNAAGQVPHMVFLVDFIVRGLERDLATGARVW